MECGVGDAGGARYDEAERALFPRLQVVDLSETHVYPSAVGSKIVVPNLDVVDLPAAQV